MRSKSVILRLIIGALLIMLMLTPVSTVSADQPISYPALYEYEGPLEFQPCPGIEVWYHEYAPYTETLFFDKDGNLRKVQDHFRGTDTFYNPEKPGFALVGDFNGILEYDVETDTLSGRGLPIHITVPGYGTVFMWSGYWTIYPTVHRGGIDSLQDPKDLEAFCSLLASD